MRRLVVVLTALAAASAPALAQNSGVPVPSPFPGAGAPPSSSSTQPRTPPPAAPVEAQPAPSSSSATTTGPNLGGISIYPGAEFLDTVDAGAGQQYHLYGTNTTYSEIVSYYRTVLKNGGREIYRAPGLHQFDLGRFNESRMVYPPSIVVKDYADGTPSGYLFVSGTTEKRFRTIIQIVPPSAP